MDNQIKQTCTSIHYAFRYVFAGAWTAERQKCLDFEKRLLDEGIDFAQSQSLPNAFVLSRNEKSPLQVKLIAQAQAASVVEVISDQPQYHVELFIKEAQAVLKNYRQIWRPNNCQVLASNARIRQLYSFQDHAFKYLWERRLGQTGTDFKKLGNKPVLGGGLRLIMPPTKQEPEPLQIELRIESYFRNPKQMFVETAFTWPKSQSMTVEDNFEIDKKLKSLQNYSLNEVWDFLANPPA